MESADHTLYSALAADSKTVPSAAAPLLPPFARPESPWSLSELDTIHTLPAASRLRQIVKLANNNLSNGYCLFVHYVQPTLTRRRDALIGSGTTRKKYYKTVGKLWHDLEASQKAFWNGEAARLRHGIKGKAYSHEECVRSAGFPDHWDIYIEYAETAVANYLGTPLPIIKRTQDIPDNSLHQTDELKSNENEVVTTSNTSSFEMSPLASSIDQPLLDTLSETFTVTPRMLYGHFALYDLDGILTAHTRKRQIEKLRQLADLFDQTGKVLFYYYAYPRLWKRLRPMKADESIATSAQEIWRFAEGPVVEQWRVAEMNVKRMLGDGDLEGLALLRLDGMDGEVLRLHRMAEEAVCGRLGEPSV